MNKSVTLVIPAYNEEKYIQSVLKRAKQYIPARHIIVVNDGSTDNTGILAQKEQVRVLEQKNTGKGGAARKGCDYALDKGYDTIILMDADGQHEPEEIPRLLKNLNGKDIVYTYRKNGSAPLRYRIGNWGLRILTTILFGIHIKDSQCGFRAFTTKTYKQIRWMTNHYFMESEMIARARGLRYTELPIKRIYHEKYKGTTPLDGLKIGWEMIKMRIKI